MVKKILIVLPSFLNGGTNTCLRSLLPVLKDHKFDVDVFAITNVGPNREYAAKYANVLGVGGDAIEVRSKPTFSQRVAFIVKSIKKALCKVGIDISPVVFKKVASQLERNNYDLIISYQEGITTHFCSYFTHTPMIAWVHCDYEMYLKAAQKKPEIKRYSKFKKVVCVSEFAKGQFTKFVNSCSNVYALHNITDDKLINERAQISIVDPLYEFAGIKIVSVGRINEVKRFSEIPRIISELKANGLKEFRWYLIGDGDEEEKEKLLANQKKYEAKELILLGNKDNPYPYIKSADLFVVTSSTEACPCVVAEAQILHTPIVATDFSSVFEFIKNRETGIISNIDNISDSIVEYFTDANLQSSIIRNVENFTFENESIINKLTNEILL